MPTKSRVPAIEGWFTTDTDQPALLGQRCTACGTFSFPKSARWCPSPTCTGHDAEEVALSTRGTVWSYTDARYQPPPPYVVPGDKHEPFAIVAVELAAEGLVVLGQVVPGVAVDGLSVGDEVELVVGTLFEDEDHEYLIWKWRPTTIRRGAAS